MSTYGVGDRVRITLNDSGRRGTVRECLRKAPPGAAEGSGPWYVVRWDAMPDRGHGVQDAPVEHCDVERIR